MCNTSNLNTLLYSSFDDSHSDFKIIELKGWQHFGSYSARACRRWGVDPWVFNQLHLLRKVSDFRKRCLSTYNLLFRALSIVPSWSPGGRMKLSWGTSISFYHGPPTALFLDKSSTGARRAHLPLHSKPSMSGSGHSIAKLCSRDQSQLCPLEEV